MMITQSPSPNFDERKSPVRVLVLHYTGMETGAAALERLCDPAAKVSAHYLVETDGRVFQMVGEDSRAWHAGVSEWAGITDLNSASVGIEIVNGGHDWRDADGGLPAYPDMQINAVIALSKAVMTRHNIPARNVVGHSDIAPARKKDPGEHFPWAGLAAAGIGLWPKGIETDNRLLFGPDQRDRGVAIAQRGLAHIGYGARVSGILDTETQDIIKALQRRYRPDHIDGIIDMQTMDIIKALVELNSIA
ncbi:N-acetylmuramoyl-L-alanine amidase [Fretibacter rubidus]|uniref:N-acetylmuramoyl-L-alanine amidase n=1 Tax=Fretibacter rubidus TaxID=570162 RepID=UPI00352A01A9